MDETSALDDICVLNLAFAFKKYPEIAAATRQYEHHSGHIYEDDAIESIDRYVSFLVSALLSGTNSAHQKLLLENAVQQCFHSTIKCWEVTSKHALQNMEAQRDKYATLLEKNKIDADHLPNYIKINVIDQKISRIKNQIRHSMPYNNLNHGIFDDWIPYTSVYEKILNDIEDTIEYIRLAVVDVQKATLEQTRTKNSGRGVKLTIVAIVVTAILTGVGIWLKAAP